jgi:uncharacterized protein YceK
MANMQRADKNDNDAPAPGRIFGGVGRDMAWAKQCYETPSSPDNDKPTLANQIKGAYYSCVDLPFSFIGDTLTLPITLLVAVGEEEDSLQVSGDRGGVLPGR